MKTIPRCFWLLALLCSGAFSISAYATPIEDMNEAADHYLAALTPDQKAKGVFELKSDERLNWHFIPKARKGLPLKEMEMHQRHLAMALLNTAMSQRGFMKATTIMSLEQILKDMEKGSGPTRDPEMYYFSIFGTPGGKNDWGWRVEGHHLSLNFTIAGGSQIAVTPSFMGTNPGEVLDGPRKGLRLLGHEEDAARKLVQSLSDEQKQVAIYTNKAPSEIITGAARKVHGLDPQGLSIKQMNKEQAELLWSVIKDYVGRYRGEIADKDLEKIQNAGADKIYFAWAGSTTRGEAHYYRIQGPTFLMEYDNTQNNANHVHAVWRDLTSDFGEDILREHYDQDHK